MATPSSDVSPPIDTEALRQIEAATSRLSADQLIWASGYLAGRAASTVAGLAPVPAALEQPATGLQWTILYATETGNSRRLAEQLADRAQMQGMNVSVIDLATFKPRQLKKETNVLFITATHGLGEAPDGTQGFFDYLLSERAARLEQLTYSVLSLGDSSYDDFCKVGRELDERLQSLGATRLAERVDCDVDFDDPAERWIATVVDTAKALAPVPEPARQPPRLRAVPSANGVWSRKRPFAATVLANQKITGRQSTKDVRHIELSLEDSGIVYKPGDALGIMPQNPPQLVEQLLELVKLDAQSPVAVGDDTLPLGQALSSRLEITATSRGFLSAWATIAHSADLEATLQDTTPGSLRRYLASHQVVDIIAQHPAAVSPQTLAESLRRLTPRLYSIASSADANPDEVHLTVGRVNYEAFGREHWGCASEFLSGSQQDAEIPVYVEPNERFRLPQDGDTPVIMIGAGTGVAPYRAFLQQRAHNGDRGRNWLIFGDRTFHNDFLYQVEWLRFRREGLLTRLDVAFSRDQKEKVYVQDRIAEHQRELYEWLEAGAHVYVCGDMQHMAPDVHKALRSVIVSTKHCTPAAAEEELRLLRQAGRYQQDVY